jgi:dUTP pyrophosphatase
MRLKYKKLEEGASAPRFASDGAACFDLVSLVRGAPICIAPREAKIVATGLAFEVPEGHVMMVYSRSGHGFKSGVRLANCTGVIDSDYRGEVMVKLINEGDLPFFIGNGERVAQAMIVQLPQYELEESDELGNTARGTSGFGSTGV